MRTSICALVLFLAGCYVAQAVDSAELRARLERAEDAFADGVVLLHATSALTSSGDGFRQSPLFYYFTGLENTEGAILAIDGKSRQSLLFLPTKPAFASIGMSPEAQPGQEAAQRLAINHVVDWSELSNFLAQQSAQSARVYYAPEDFTYAELPQDFLHPKALDAPGWLQIILKRYPGLDPHEAAAKIDALLTVQSEEEVAALRLAGKASVIAWTAGLRTIRPIESQRNVEATVEKACWNAGAHGPSFWPWAMSGESGVLPKPFLSLVRYDHLNQMMKPGDLVRLDVGCESSHYLGDFGRTVPVSGHFSEEQRETWTIFVAAYLASLAELRAGSSVTAVFDAWRRELVSHRAAARSSMAQRAIDLWSDQKNIPYWQVHNTNLLYTAPTEPFRAGMTVNFEPIASIDGQGFYLEDMFLITKDAPQILTPGGPYSAEEIEAAMR